jgi:hypothetical protein
MKFIDLTGQRFGRLLVLERDYDIRRMTKGTQPTFWRCLCDCGVTKTIGAGNLKKHTQSCGCLARELASERRQALAPDPNASLLNWFYRGYKHGATKRRLPFELSLEETALLGIGDCHYCGTPPSRQIYNHARRVSPQGDMLLNGIDRLDNSKGYSLANCVSCCSICNLGKNTLPLEVWLQYLDRLVAFRSRK